jgi:hypothetical protein
LEHKEHPPTQKTEPSFQSGNIDPATASSSSNALPAWLKQQQAEPEPTALRRWGRRIAFLGVALVCVAVAGGATYAGLELYDTYGEREAVPDSSQAQAAVRTAKPLPPAQADALPYAEKRTPTLPPLVMLPHDQVPKTPPPPLAAVPAPVPVSVPAKVEKVVPPANAVHKQAVPHAKPVVAPKKVAAGPVKPGVKPAARPAVPAAKKPAPVAKAKAAPVPVAQRETVTALKPPADAAPRKAVDSRCQPGELARECAARTQ